MPSIDFRRLGRTAPRALFLQATEPGSYPPLVHASVLMAEAGWEVTFLASPMAGIDLQLPRHPRISRRAIAMRPSHVMRRSDYARYLAAAARLSLQLRPDIVYASDPLGAAPGLLAAKLASARLVYHEHDSPAPGLLRGPLGRARAIAARRARIVIFPNEVRARYAQYELGFSADRVRIVWNMPRCAELPTLDGFAEAPLLLHYHGSIAPDRLPLAAVDAVRRWGGKVNLRIAGYEAPGAAGYLRHLIDRGGGGGTAGVVHYLGQILRTDLVSLAARAHVGLAFILLPAGDGSDLNMANLTGASNKAFEYMAASLALLVSDREDWRAMFVRPGYARACDPADPESIAAALAWFLDHPAERRDMGARGRAKIAADWNYDTAFAPIMNQLVQE
jgi:glycosyltransferase involved in cell wall biosynthesis